MHTEELCGNLGRLGILYPARPADSATDGTTMPLANTMCPGRHLGFAATSAPTNQRDSGANCWAAGSKAPVPPAAVSQVVLPRLAPGAFSSLFTPVVPGQDH